MTMGDFSAPNTVPESHPAHLSKHDNSLSKRDYVETGLV